MELGVDPSPYALCGDERDVVNLKAIERPVHCLWLLVIEHSKQGELATAPDTTLTRLSVLHKLIKAHEEEVVEGIRAVQEAQVLQSVVQVVLAKGSNI